jgi:rubredoxin
MTLGSAAAAGVGLIVRCRNCGHRIEPDPAEQAQRYGAGTPVPDWRQRLACPACGSRDVDMVVTGTGWRGLIPSDRPTLRSQAAFVRASERRQWVESRLFAPDFCAR